MPPAPRPPQSPLKQLSAPYNFVPWSPNDPVVTPEWQDDISLDVPFVDGICGTIALRLVADSPVLVAIDQRKIENDREAATEARMARLADGRAVIPGSSLRGLIRSVVEMISFSRFAPIDDRRMSVRDLYNKGLYLDYFTETVGTRTYKAKTKAGWLRRDPQDPTRWVIVPCQLARIEQADLERKIGSKADMRLGSERPFKKDKKDQPLRSALIKYAAWEELVGPDRTIAFRPPREDDHNHSPGQLRYRKVDEFTLGPASTNGFVSGTVVFAGQPGDRERPGEGRKRCRKHMEFVFFAPCDRAAAGEIATKLVVPDPVRRDFEALQRGEDGGFTQEWSGWRKDLNAGRPVAVFYLTGGDGQVSHLGLCQMFRLPYAHTAASLVRQTMPPAELRDFAECVFGRVERVKRPDGGTVDALRGRCTFDMAVVEKDKEVSANPLLYVLGQPKPSYYPAYVQQPGAEQGRLPGDAAYRSWHDAAAVPRGWKRYPSRTGGPSAPNANPDNRKVNVRLYPIGAGSEAVSALRVHNLRPAELGAVLWALTWGDKQHLCHGLGLAKGMGLGQVRFLLEQEDLHCPASGEAVDRSVCLRAFEEAMRAKVPTWGPEHPRLKTLLAMADPAEGARKAALLQPMRLERNVNQFNTAKGERLTLPAYVPLPANAAPKPATSPRPGPVHAPRAGAAAGRRGIYQDDKVAVLREKGGEYLIEDPQGDTDWVPTSQVRLLP